jgi:transcription factor WhiB
MGSTLGAAKTAARKIGCTVEEWLTRRAKRRAVVHQVPSLVGHREHGPGPEPARRDRLQLPSVCVQQADESQGRCAMRSAFNLDSRGDNWRGRAICATAEVRPDMWETTSGRNGEAAHICLEHCPVRQQCLDDAVDAGADRRRSVVLAGIAFDQLGHPMPAQSPAGRCRLCPGVWADAIDNDRRARAQRERRRREAARSAAA